jgi:hypothetical protein
MIPQMRLAGWIAVLATVLSDVRAIAATWEQSPYFNEETCNLVALGSRTQLNATQFPATTRELPTRLIIYALPNGNSIEWTIGAKRAPGLDWHYDIQHIGAQMRRWREVNAAENLVIAYVEADGKSWPAWRQKHKDDEIRELIDVIRAQISGENVRITLAGHSGGGSFLHGFIEGGDEIPATIDRIVFLDANYSYDDGKHGAKLMKWLNRAKDHRLIVMAYDDRNVELNGKKIVSDTGGTYRATGRMVDRFSKDLAFEKAAIGDFQTQTALDGQVRVLVHPNPQNKILHTTMVGEMSGFLYSMCVDTPAQERWGTLQGEKTWEKWIQPAPEVSTTQASTQPARTRTAQLSILPRPQTPSGGRAFMKSIENLPKETREEAIAKEFLSGNVPVFLRTLKTIRARAMCVDGIERTIEYEVMPDYLSVGSDEDFVRVPMNPHTAQAIADAYGCSLPTRKMVDDIDSTTTVKLEPRPLTESREAVTTFVQHHEIIEAQRKEKPLGELICGIKKDVVITNRLLEKPNRVAIYGWRQLDGKPIQPLTIVHVDWYVDYSHGVRLVQREVKVDGKAMMIEDVLTDPHLHVLLSDEGTMKVTRYEREE